MEVVEEEHTDIHRQVMRSRQLESTVAVPKVWKAVVQEKTLQDLAVKRTARTARLVAERAARRIFAGKLYQFL